MKCGRGTGNPDLLLFNWTVFFIGLFFTTAVFENSAEDMYRVFGGVFGYIWKKNTDHADAAFARLSAVLMA